MGTTDRPTGYTFKHKMRFFYVFTLLLLTTQWSEVISDDSFECCMAGWKRVGSVDICSAPCCPGYREVVENPPYLQAVSFCVKDPKANDYEKLVNLRNDLHSYWQRRK